MFERISNGWSLAKQSWRVLMLDKELLVFPLCSGVACLVVLASFLAPLWASGYAEILTDDQQTAQDVIGYVLLFLFYFANYFVIVFFNAALIGCAIIRFKGGNPTLGDGFSTAFRRLPQIAGWALVSATVGLILRLIESRSERVGQIVSGLLGAAWSVMTYFVVPVLVVEQLGPIAATQRSIGVIRKTWGEALAANFGIGFLVFLASLAGILPLVAGVYLLATGVTVPGAILAGAGVLLLILVGLASSALDAIVVGALYLYAAEGTVPQQFDDNALRGAFAHR